MILAVSSLESYVPRFAKVFFSIGYLLWIYSLNPHKGCDYDYGCACNYFFAFAGFISITAAQLHSILLSTNYLASSL